MQKADLYSLKTVTIDARLIQEDYSRNKLREIIECLETNNINFYIIYRNNEELNECKSFSKSLNCDIKYIKNDEPNYIAKTIIETDNDRDLSMPERITKGKEILNLSPRSSRFIDVFTPPKGIVCYPFHKIVWQTQCPFDCSYCFLQLTFRMAPYNRVYLNLDKMFKEIIDLDKKSDRPLVLNSGELCDPLPLDHITNISNEVIDTIEKLKNIKLLLLSKSDNIEHLKPVNDSKVIFSVSLTTPYNQQRFEHRTAKVEARIEALRRAEEKGYKTRVRIDPIITAEDNWLNEYEKIIERLFERTNIEVITLGQPRFYTPLLNIIKSRYPEDGKYFAESVTVSEAGHGKKIDINERQNIYRSIYSLVNKYANEKNVKIAVCKEELKVSKNIGICPGNCNCI